MNNYPKLEDISLEQLDKNDLSFLMSFASDLTELTESIKTIGVITPIIVQKKENNMFRIVNGFKRFSIAKNFKISSLKAFVIEANYPFLDIFNMALSENRSIRDFNIIEKALVVKSLQTEGLSEEFVKRNYLIKLSLKYYPELFSWLQKILKLPLIIQEQLAKDSLSYYVIDFIDILSLKEQMAFIDLLNHFKLGKNKQKEFINLLQDILRIEGKSFSAYLQEFIELDGSNSHLTSSQKSEKLFKYLRTKRYPLYSEYEDSFNKWKNSLKLSSLKLEHFPFFESTILKGSFSLKDKKILTSIISDLEKIKNSSDNQWLAINNKED